MPFRQTWDAPPISTDSRDAAACYRRGISALVAGIANAGEPLAEAVGIDPDFFLARVGIAAANALGGQLYHPPSLGVGVLRGERQHAEIVALVFAGSHQRAADLRREHLLDYPGDLLVVWLPAQTVAG